MRVALPFDRQTIQRFLWFAGFGGALWIFLELMDEVLEPSEVAMLDAEVLLLVAELRVAWLNGVMVDLTALGSTTLIALHSGLAWLILLATRDRVGAAQLVAASAGAGLLIFVLKPLLERDRPTSVATLVDVTGYSYPSGHSLGAAAMYFTIAIVACRHLPRIGSRAVVAALAVAVVSVIALSRVYLGVHYPTDVASGIALGLAWSLLLAGGFSWWESRTAALRAAS